MAQPCAPRHGSMQYWPRKRARRHYARVRSWAQLKDVKPLGFAGYKASMSHITILDSGPNSMTRGIEIPMPVTVVECPALRVISARFYKKTVDGLKVVSEVLAEKVDKDVGRKIILPKKPVRKLDDVRDFDDLRIGVATQPGLTGIGKKKPEVFELAISGSKEEKLNYARQFLGKELRVHDVFKPGCFVDVHAVSRGKGYQGPVKRFGVGLRSHKSEKTKRGPGSLGAWKAQGHMMYRVAHAGQMGFHQRVDYNKLLVKVFDEPRQLNPKGGITNYGVLKNPAVLLKGSVPGAKKRLVMMTHAIRNAAAVEEPNVTYIHSR